MRSIRDLLSQPFQAAVAARGGQDNGLQATRDPKFGDYQCNATMALARQLGMNPRQLGQELLEEVAPGMAEQAELELAGPGFINLRLKQSWLQDQTRQLDLSRWESRQPPGRVVVDYSSPNVAKEMHVGHIRSTILGDAICRILQYGGNTVIRQNHLGDWGTQFGMLCAYLRETNPSETAGIGGLEDLYRAANGRFESDPAFQERARQAVVALHQGDPDMLSTWEKVLEQSRAHFQPLYARLGVLLNRDDERGESFYRDRLAEVVGLLEREFPPGRNTAGQPYIEVRTSDGALCVFHFDESGHPCFLSSEQEPLPFLIRKSDGAFLYSSTDLAALRYRVFELLADRIIVVTDARQALHFKMLMATARAAGWLNPAGRPPVNMEHITFGSILGPDRKPLKTRSGGTVKLSELLDEAVERSQAMLRDPEKQRGFSEEQIRAIAEAIGVGSVKYADLAQNRSTDYIFSWDKMLSMEGNTAPYLMYAYARIASITRRGGEVDPGAPIHLADPAERALALSLLRFAETLDSVEDGWKVNLLADYLYQTAGAFMKFYEQCPVLKAESPELLASRLALCARTARTLEIGLGLLGIRVLEEM